MTPRLRIRVAGAGVAALLALGVSRADAPLAAQQRTPQFRVVADAVTVDAFAHRDRTPIAGLTRGDFILRDNGVEQNIETIGTTDSAHVIVGLDVSGSVDGETLGRLRAAVRAVLAQLTSNDRFSLVTFGNRLRLLSRAAVPGDEANRALDALTAVGSTTLHDAIVVGSALATADSRPAVCLLFTDGEDTGSWSTVTRAIDAVRNGHVVVYPIGAGLPGVMASLPSTDYFRHPTWLAPLPGDTLRLLQVLADVSGGEFLRVRRDARLSETFAAILAQYRQRYLLSFTPTGVGNRGWHRLEVRLRNRPGSVVAREGYMARSQ